MRYQVMACITKTKGKYRSTRGIPTFYLDPDVQGLINEEHAARIARGMLNPFDDSSLDVNVQVNRVEN